MADTVAYLKKLIREVVDFPQPGVAFKDITTLLKDGKGFGIAVDAMLTPFSNLPVDLVVGIEARGFILAAPLAVRLGCGFVPIRKSGKLPAPTISEEYELEYGKNIVEIHQDAIQKGQKVLIVDDVLATGGTALAACQLLDRIGAEVVGLNFLVELLFLKGRENLNGFRIEALVQY